MGLSDHALRERSAQLSFRRLVAERLDDQWMELLRALQQSLDYPPHVALVHNESDMPSEALLAALATSLGLLADPYRQEWSRVLQPIRRRADGSTTDARWHTDSPGWPRPNDIACLLCVRPAENGGATQVLPWPVIRTVLGVQPALLDRMCTYQVPWVLDAELGADVREPVITENGIRYMREAFERSATHHPQDAASVIALHEAACDLLDAATDFYTMRLAAGEVLIFDNRRCLHRRGPIDPDDGRNRTLIRARVQQPAWTRAAGPVVQTAANFRQERYSP
jgi:hypothetical protein